MTELSGLKALKHSPRDRTLSIGHCAWPVTAKGPAMNLDVERLALPLTLMFFDFGYG
jgi:hypothetical protein